MSEPIEVLFFDRIGPYDKNKLYLLQDGVFLRALLKSGRGAVVNPPDWSPEKADGLEANVKAELDKILEKANTKVEVSNGDSSSTDKEVSVEVEVAKPAGTDKGYRKKSSELPKESTTDSTEGYGGSGEFSEVTEEDSSGSGNIISDNLD